MPVTSQLFSFLGQLLGSKTLRRAALAAFAYYLLRRLYRRHIGGRSVAGRTVLVTGGGSGIGRLAALEFARRGAKAVVLWDINRDGLEETKAEVAKVERSAAVGGGACAVHTYAVDISNRTRVYEAADRVKADVGVVDVLVNNAGIVSGADLLDLPDAKIIKTFEVNTLAHFWTVKAFMPGMMEQQWGHIVNVASAAGFFGSPRMTDYAASKFAARGFTDSLRLELWRNGVKGVHASCFCPGHVNTQLFEGFRTMVPTLDARYVASRIVDTVEDNQALVCLPRFVYFAVIMSSLVPTPVLDWTNAITGVTSSMANFKPKQAVATFKLMGTEGADDSSEESWDKVRVSPEPHSSPRK